jgi:hypothetical protein
MTDQTMLPEPGTGAAAITKLNGDADALNLLLIDLRAMRAKVNQDHFFFGIYKSVIVPS